MTRRLTALFLILLMFSLPSTAWCNKQEQPNGSGSGSGDFVLPETEPSTEPFSFENPDPRRRIRTLDGSFDPKIRTSFVVVVSTQLNSQQALTVQQGILGLIAKGLCHPRDSIDVWDSDMSRLARFRNHERVQDCSETWAKFRIQPNAKEIGRLNRFFEDRKQARLDGSAALDLPHLAHHVGQEFHEHSVGNRVLIIYGSATDLSPEVPFTRTAYPTIGQLRSELSPFSTRGMANNLGNISTHWVYLNRFAKTTHRQGMENFLAAYFLSQGSPLLTFSADPEVARRARMADLPSIEAYVDDINPGFVSTQSADLFGSGFGSTAPTNLERGSFLLGLKWEPSTVDLDLHVGVSGTAERISFRVPETSFGTFAKQPGNGWEMVRLSAEYPPESLDVAVNFFGGTAPSTGVKAEVRVIYAGTLFSQEVAFRGRGNQGQVGSPDHWQQVNLLEILRLR